MRMDCVLVPSYSQLCRERDRQRALHTLTVKRDLSLGFAATTSHAADVKPKVEIDEVKVKPESDSTCEFDASQRKIKYEASPTPNIRRETPEINHGGSADNSSMTMAKHPKSSKKEEMIFDFNVLNWRFKRRNLSTAQFPVTLAHEIREVMVSRKFIAKTYGGSSQRTFPKISPGRVKVHGYNDFMFLASTLQPLAPEVPGFPGLFLGVGDDNVDGRELRVVPQRVFTRITKSAKGVPPLYQYQGQYHVVGAKSLSREEWQTQAPSVRNSWASELALPSCRWCSYVRIRVYYHKTYNRSADDMTEAERQEICSSKVYDTITPEDISLALYAGRETLRVFTLRCVGYDEDFQKSLAEKWKNWTPPAKVPGKRQATGTQPGHPRKKRRGAGTNAQAKRRDAEEREEEEEDEELEYGESRDGRGWAGDDSEEELEPQLKYTPRGTKSRPIVLR